MAEITGDYAEHTKEDLLEEIDRRGLDKPGSRANKDELIGRLEADDDNPDKDAQPSESDTDAADRSTNSGEDGGDDQANPPGGDGAGASAQGDGDDDDIELSSKAGDPAVAEKMQLLLNEQHGASPEIVEQSEELEDSLEEREEEAKSHISTISDEEAKAVFDHNTAVPLWRRNTEDLTDEQKEAPSDFPTPQGDGALEYSEEHQDAADAEREKKNATLPKFDEREQYDDRVGVESQKPERLGTSGRGGMPQSDEDEVKPWVGGGDRQKYTAPEDTTFLEIATELGLAGAAAAELPFINGRYDGTQHVAKGTELLLPDGYVFE